jgi:hypothetical protein
MAVTCLLLGISGGIRFWRDRQFQAMAQAGAICPFPLTDLPKTLGSWRWVEGAQGQLDPEVAATAGSSENILRDYVDEIGGGRTSIVVLYGLAATVFAHAPGGCYPAHGYRLIMGPEDRPISVPGLKDPAVYRAAIYARKVGATLQYELVYSTFFHNGQWLPDLAGRWKSFRYHPGAFKIQLQHTISSQLALEDGPSEALLGQLIREVTRRAGQPPPAA